MNGEYLENVFDPNTKAIYIPEVTGNIEIHLDYTDEDDFWS
jgi:hypothetical protein